MDIKRFWELIDLIDLDAAYQPDAPRPLGRLVEALAPLDQVEVESFFTHVANCLKSLNSTRIREKCRWGHSGEGFLYHRLFVVARGREFFEQMIAEPHQLKDVDQFDEMLYELEDLDLFLAEQGV